MRNSMLLTIELVESRAQLEEFIKLPRQLYAGMEGYTPPLDLEQRALIDPTKNPFFTHGTAAYWIARSKGRAVGRISAQINSLAGPHDPSGLGFFGALAAINDAEVFARLFAAAEEWLEARGCRHIRGPFTLAVHGEAGILLEGQTEPPMILFPWNPVYLDERVREVGYICVKKLFCLVLNLKNFTLEKLQKINANRERRHLAIRDMRRKTIEADMQAVLRMFNDAWAENWGFAPASEADARGLVKSLKPFLFDDTSFFIDVRGEPAAFVVSIPNVYEISADLGPAPNWLGWLKLAYRIWRQRYKSFQVVMLGVVSKYQSNILGSRLAATAVAEVVLRLHSRGVEEIATGWVLEGNPLLKFLYSLDFRINRTYWVYEKALGR